MRISLSFYHQDSAPNTEPQVAHWCVDIYDAIPSGLSMLQARKDQLRLIGSMVTGQVLAALPGLVKGPGYQHTTKILRGLQVKKVSSINELWRARAYIYSEYKTPTQEQIAEVYRAVDYFTKQVFGTQTVGFTSERTNFDKASAEPSVRI